ncbi:hypothetical protein DRO66_00515 [Candidatus Bathyarchaeota archaeon]|nr:MAG: hypothetical protein DRO66_00515 [Candidatus Bathyarchaeota archaeon]
MAETEKELLALIKANEERAREINEKLHEYGRSICPFKIGDTVTSYGYTHYGKKVTVTKVFGKVTYRPNRTKGVPPISGKVTCYPKEDIIWKAHGIVLKKDGNVTRFHTEWDSKQGRDIKPKRVGFAFMCLGCRQPRCTANCPEFKLLEGERILQAAILKDGTVYEGWSHAEIIRKASPLRLGSSGQGFVTETKIFVDRKVALAIAEIQGQIVKKHAPVHELLSEDLRA